MAEDGAPKPDARIDRTTLIGLFTVALVVRVLYTLFRDVGFAIVPGSDAVSYDVYARAILGGTGWILHPGPELFRPPGYPMILAFLYAVTGHNLAIVQCLQSIAGAGSVALVYVFGCRHMGRAPALLAAVWLLVNPLQLDFNGKLLRETWLVLLNVALLWSLLRRDGLTLRGIVRTALLFTLLMHIDSRYLFHLPFFAVYLAFAARRPGDPLPNARWVKPAAQFVVLVILFSTPWAVRNQLAYDRFVLIDPRTLDRWAKKAEASVAGDAITPAAVLARFEAAKTARLDSLTAVEADAFRRGLRPAFGQPAKAIFNFTEFWRILDVRPEYRPFPDARFAPPWSLEHNLSSLVFMGLLLPAFLIGTFRGVAALDRVTLVLAAFIVVHTLLHVVVHSVVRYRLPIEPFYALIAFREMMRRFPRRRA